MNEKSKYNHCIYFDESDPSGILWTVARRDSKRPVITGLSSDYDHAIRDSEEAFYRIPKEQR